MNSPFRLLTFNVNDSIITNSDSDSDSDDNKYKQKKKTIIQMFGLNETGNSSIYK